MENQRDIAMLLLALSVGQEAKEFAASKTKYISYLL